MTMARKKTAPTNVVVEDPNVAAEIVTGDGIDSEPQASEQETEEIIVTSRVSEPAAKVRVLQTHRCTIGGTPYVLTEGREATVPRSVAAILQGSYIVAILGISN